MAKARREIAREVDEILGHRQGEHRLTEDQNPSFRLLYLTAGRRSLSPEEFSSVEDAARAVNFFKARGFTAWVEDETGKFVPVKGALRKPLFHLAGSVIGRRAPRRATHAHTRVLRSGNFGPLEVRGPAVRMVELPIGGKTKHGDTITKYTPEWARLSQEKIADDVKLEGARESGHDIEGHKRYSAFTSGGPDDFVIVRNYRGKA